MRTTETAIVEFNELQNELAGLVAPTLEIKVTSAASSAAAIDAAKQVKALQGRIEKQRKELVGPLNDRVKAINEYAKTIVAPLNNAEMHLKRELANYEMEQERIRQAKLREAEEERKRKEAELAEKQAKEREQLAAIQAEEAVVVDMFGDDPAEPAVDRAAALEERQAQEQAKLVQEAKAQEYDVKRAHGISGAKKVWKCEALDLSLVPKEYLIITLNEKAVLAMARAGVTKIPGVRLWQDTQIAISANTRAPALPGRRDP